MIRELNLSGKDYFSATEAAHYCCLSQSQFDENIAKEVAAINVAGRKVFSREALKTYIEGCPPWQRLSKGSAEEVGAFSSFGGRLSPAPEQPQNLSASPKRPNLQPVRLRPN